MEKNIEYWLYPQTGGTTPIVSFDNYNSVIPSNQRMIRSRYWKSQPSGLPIRGTGTAQTLNTALVSGTTGVSPNLAYPPIVTIPFREFYIGPIDTNHTTADLASNCNYSINQSESFFSLSIGGALPLIDQSNNQLIQRYKVRIYKYCGHVDKFLGPTGSQGPVTDISFTIGVTGVFGNFNNPGNWNEVSAEKLNVQINELIDEGNFGYVSCGCTGPTTGLTGGCDPSGNAISVSITPLDQDTTPQWNKGHLLGQRHDGYSGNISLTIPFYYKELFTN